MKTKKITLRGLSEKLSAKELKNVMGGSGTNYCWKCSNGAVGNCATPCYDLLGEICPGGWMSWDC